MMNTEDGAAYGLAEGGPAVTAGRIGLREIVFGALVVAPVAAVNVLGR